MADKIISLYPNGDEPAKAKYSDILYDFVEPFIDRYPDDVALDEIFWDGLSVWNVAVMTSVLPEDDRNESLKLATEESPNNPFFMEMVKHKDEHFATFDHIYEKFEFHALDGEEQLTVEVTDLNSLLNGLQETLSVPSGLTDGEGMVDRLAIIIKAKQPLLDWAAELFPNELIDISTTDPVVYLIELEEDIPSENYFKKHFDRYFQSELESWCADKKLWPQRRTHKMFHQWFDVQVSSMVYDMEETPLLKF